MRQVIKKLQLTTKEDKLEVKKKFDAINLQGVWTNFPQRGGNGFQGAGGRRLFLEFLHDEARQRLGLITNPNKSVLDEMIKKLEMEYTTNLVLFLTAV